MSEMKTRPTGLRFHARPEKDRLVIDMEGELIFRAHQCFKPLIEQIESCEEPTVYVDLKKLQRTDITTIGLLMVLREAADAANKNLVIVNTPREVTGVAGMSRSGRQLDLKVAA